MRLIGHGVDIVQTRTINNLLDDPHNDFIDSWFTSFEKAQAPQNKQGRIHYFGGRHAAKEAVVKALGIGLIGEMAWTDVEIIRLPSGAPSVKLSDETLRRAEFLGVTNWLISISHSDDYTIASAIALGNEPSS